MLTIGATVCILGMKCRAVQIPNGVVDEVGRMALRQPLLQGPRRELLLVGCVGGIACAHASLHAKTVLSALQNKPIF